MTPLPQPAHSAAVSPASQKAVQTVRIARPLFT
jgi:hypothetical protein